MKSNIYDIAYYKEKYEFNKFITTSNYWYTSTFYLHSNWILNVSTVLSKSTIMSLFPWLKADMIWNWVKRIFSFCLSCPLRHGKSDTGTQPILNKEGFLRIGWASDPDLWCKTMYNMFTSFFVSCNVFGSYKAGYKFMYLLKKM